METQKETAVYFIICCLEDLVVILQRFICYESLHFCYISQQV